MISEEELQALLEWFSRNPRLDSSWLPGDFGERIFGTIGGGELRSSEALEFFTWLLYAGTFRWNMYSGPKRQLLRQLQSLLHLIVEFPGDFAANFSGKTGVPSVPSLTKIWWIVAEWCTRLRREFGSFENGTALKPEDFVARFAQRIDR